MDIYKQIATSYICNAIILIENMDDLKDSKLYTNQVKFYGNKFIKELESKILPIEKALASNDEDYKMVQDIQLIYESIFKRLAKMELKDIMNVSTLIDELLSGNLIQATPEQIKQIKDAEQ